MCNSYTCCSKKKEKKVSIFGQKKSSLGYVLSKLLRYNFNLV